MSHTTKCPACKFNVTLGPATCIAVIFEDALGYSFLRIECPRPQCQTEWATFMASYVGDDYRGVENLVREMMGTPGQSLELLGTPDQTVLADWAEAHNSPVSEIHELTAHEQTEVEFFLWDMEHGGLNELCAGG